MWMILKAELAYTRSGLLIGFSIAVCFLLGAVLYQAWPALQFMLNTSIVFFISIGILGSEADKERRMRIHASLPVRPGLIGLVEQFYILLFQLSLVLQWLLFFVIKDEVFTASSLAAMLSATGLLLALINVFILHTHLKFWGSKHFRLLTFFALFSIAGGIALLIWLNLFDLAWHLLRELFFSIPGSFIFVAGYIAMAALATAASTKRKSFLA